LPYTSLSYSLPCVVLVNSHKLNLQTNPIGLAFTTLGIGLTVCVLLPGLNARSQAKAADAGADPSFAATVATQADGSVQHMQVTDWVYEQFTCI